MIRLARAAWPVIGAAVAISGCGGFSVPTDQSFTPPPGGNIRIGTAAVERVPGGGTLEITLVSYNPNTHERSPDPGTPLVAGVTVRIRNAGKVPLHLAGVGSYAVLELLDETGASAVARTNGPCDGRFATRRLHLAPGASVRGCLPYEYTVYEPPFQFLFGFGKHRTHGWRLPHS